MEQIIDCTGMHCPEPVVHTKNALETMTTGDTVLIIVDNGESKHNVERFAKNRDCKVKIQSVGDTFRLQIKKGAENKSSAPFTPEDYACELPKLELIYLIPSDTLGHGDDDLGRILMQSFIKTIGEVSPLPQKIFFYNRGVHFVTSESNLLEPLKELADQGVEILSCGTCLDFYNLKKELKVGEMTNMYNIVEAMALATKTVTPC
ncbi:MAG: sulfurtransferase-like selenium metabolism protein YedF [Desulfobulbaceae bacterium]|nr:sulfurtransferase-like selenium metabolism protein YedF [Desulfobulbaceae bacterium]